MLKLFPHALRRYWFAHVLLAILVLIFIARSILPRPTDFWSDIEARGTSFMNEDAATQAAAGSKLHHRFEHGFDIYTVRLQMLDTNLKLQGGLAVVSLTVVLWLGRERYLGVLGFRLPMQVIRVIVPFVLLVLWLQFGYLLHHLIELRLTLWHLTRLMDHVPLETSDKLYNVMSLGSILNDGGFLDAWFRAFRATYISGVNTSFWGRLGNAMTVVLVYCSFLGGAHAAMVGMLYDNAKSARSHIARMAHWTFVVIACALLLLSHYQFAFSAGHDNWLNLAIGVFAVGFIYFIINATPEEGAEVTKKPT